MKEESFTSCSMSVCLSDWLNLPKGETLCRKIISSCKGIICPPVLEIFQVFILLWHAELFDVQSENYFGTKNHRPLIMNISNGGLFLWPWGSLTPSWPHRILYFWSFWSPIGCMFIFIPTNKPSVHLIFTGFHKCISWITTYGKKGKDHGMWSKLSA